MSDTGQNIQVVRRHRKLTALQLANAAGVSRRTVNAYEAGTRIPMYRTLAAIAKVLDVPVGDLAEPGEVGPDNSWWPTEKALALVRGSRA